MKTAILTITIIIFGLAFSTIAREGEIQLDPKQRPPLASDDSTQTPRISTEHNINKVGTFPYICGYASMEYPLGSYKRYISYIDFAFGGIIGTDTLVSGINWYELWPNDKPAEYRTILHTDVDEYGDAVSEQDFIIYCDDHTLYENDPSLREYMRDELTGRDHIPLYIDIKYKSYAWSYSYVEDIIFSEIEITNVGDQVIDNFYIGCESHPSVSSMFTSPFAPNDNMYGFLESYKLNYGCGYTDTINMVWQADNSGKSLIDPPTSLSGALGYFFLDHPSTGFRDLRYSFNWACTAPRYFDPPDWGPRLKSDPRNFHTGGNGYPIGDLNLYHIFSNGEIDYPRMFTLKISRSNPTWNFPPPELAYAIANSEDLGDIRLSYHVFYSMGPFYIYPGATITVPFAVVLGENFHTDKDNIDNLPYFPENYYKNLNFTDLVNNTQWARWIYDNPGYDTDGDGFAGKYQLCPIDSVYDGSQWSVTAVDTFFYEGDGIPDWRAAEPPPAPVYEVIPIQYGLKIRFNGSNSETKKDIFTRIADFEGYNIYMGRDERKTSLSIIASYDKYNFDKFVYDEEVGRYIVEDIPFTLERLQQLYGENFDPLYYSRTKPFIHPRFPDSLFFFRKHNFNASTFNISTPITKVFPDARDPRLVPPDSLRPDDYYRDSLFKFFEYEMIIEDLLPTVEYYLSLTAFDFGSPKSGLEALESSITGNMIRAYPLGENDHPDENDLNVYVYPNPYRIDDAYRDEGYEGRNRDDQPDFRVRAINFGNLPNKCTISIYSLDGDLVRRLDHDYLPGDPASHHDSWDMITRNTQMVVSGLYYWTVETDDGQTQMGKLVIIM